MSPIFSGKARELDRWAGEGDLPLDFLVPYPRKLRIHRDTFPLPGRARVVFPKSCEPAAKFLKTDLRKLAGVSVSAKAPFRVTLSLKKRPARREGYRLKLTRRVAEITGDDEAGLFYGVQTLLQILVLGDQENIPELDITDWPEYKLRGFMLDMGRAVFSMPLLKRAVRILARLKMNMLHLHLTDSQLCGLRFSKLPLGKENPAAITLKQLRDLVGYARKHHVTIVPELELWGHAGSLLYHFPELGGAPRPNGAVCDFGIGEEYFHFIGKVFDELLPALEKDCIVNVGFDEAKWSLLPSVPKSKEKDYTPEKLVGRVYDVLQKAGKRQGRTVTMHLWADEHGRPIPKRLRNKNVVLMPWRYWERHPARVQEKVREFGGRGKPRFMMGTGMSPGHFGGHFGATRHWCRYGVGVPNVEGVSMAMWEDNDLPGKLLGLYGGANYAWSPENPVPPEPVESDQFWERFYLEMGLRMRRWQVEFRDADDEAMREDRGPYVFRGVYWWGERAGKPVAPTVFPEK